MNRTHQGWYLMPQEVPEYVEGYRIIRLLGEGGMGFVFLAEQEHPIRRQVAIKFLKRGWDGTRLQTRFELESQMLAQMSHPNIAVVHDLGLTEGAQPFLVMEFVNGVPLDEYCDLRKMTTADRMNLFLQVCSGVIHAHQKGIIHRDLKPENLLVMEISGKPVLKIIDFGIAKDMQVKQSGSVTMDGEMLGTPYYISPEQANGQVVDTRSDVFSLGAVLFQLLTGTYPFEHGEHSFFKYLNDLVNTEAPMPSEKIIDQKKTMMINANNRQVNVQMWLREIRGDLDWITNKALARDRADRYQSVLELVRDIERYRNKLPIEARPRNRIYAIRKFISRHRVGVLAFASAFISLILALAVSIHSLNRISESERAARFSEMRALREADKSKSINEFLKNILISPDPSQDGKDVRILDLLKEYEHKFDDYEGEEEVEASVRATLGRTYLGLGQYDEASRHLRHSIKLKQTLGYGNQDETIQSKLDLSTTLLKQGKYAEGRELIQESLAYLTSANDENPGKKVLAMVLMGNALLLEGDFEQAKSFMENGYALSIEKIGPDDEQTIDAQYQIGIVFLKMDKLEEAESIFRKTLEQHNRVLGENHPRTLANLGNLGNVLFRRRKLLESEECHRKAYEARLELLGPYHHGTLFSLNNLGSVLYKQKKYKEAESLNGLAVDGFTTVLGPDHPDTLMAMNNLANVYRKQKRYPAAKELYQRALGGQIKALGQKHMETNRTRFNLIKVLIGLKDYNKVIEYCDQSISAMPEEPLGYYLKSVAALEKEDYHAAIPVLNQLLLLDETNIEVRVSLMQSYLYGGLVQDAKKHFLILDEALMDSGQREEILLTPLQEMSKKNKASQLLLKQMRIPDR